MFMWLVMSTIMKHEPRYNGSADHIWLQPASTTNVIKKNKWKLSISGIGFVTSKYYWKVFLLQGFSTGAKWKRSSCVEECCSNVLERFSSINNIIFNYLYKIPRAFRLSFPRAFLNLSINRISQKSLTKRGNNCSCNMKSLKVNIKSCFNIKHALSCSPQILIGLKRHK